MRRSSNAKGNLALGFYTYGLSPREIFRIDWFPKRGLLWAGLGTDNYKLVGSVNSDFVIANIPQGCKVYFAVGMDSIDHDHRKLVLLLERSGDVYYEKQEPPSYPEGMIELGGKTQLIRGGKPRPIAMLVGSTNSPEIIKFIFDWYSLYWESNFHFPFLVLRNELPPWKDWMEALLKHSRVTPDMIENSHCIMTTVWEHGMEIVSNKISKIDLVNAARRVAEEHQLKLVKSISLSSPCMITSEQKSTEPLKLRTRGCKGIACWVFHYGPHTGE